MSLGDQTRVPSSHFRAMVSLRDQLSKLARALAITQLGETTAENAKARGLEETSGP
jgi:hypothetical protein